MIDTEEEGVCVCCRAAASKLCSATKPEDATDGIPFCDECLEDGSAQAWLARALEDYCREAGYTMRVDENGRELWSNNKQNP